MNKDSGNMFRIFGIVALWVFLVVGFGYGFYTLGSKYLQANKLEQKNVQLLDQLMVDSLSNILALSEKDNVYTTIYTIDGEPIPIPYSKPDKDEFLAEKASHFVNDIPETPENIIIGSKAIVSDWEWILPDWGLIGMPMIENFTCGIEMGGTVTVIDMNKEGLLVEYMAPGNSGGTRCPSGIEFYISEERFLQMTNAYVAKRDAIIAEKALVDKLLADNHYGEIKDAGGWRWINVVNPEPILQKYSNGYGYLAYGDTAGCGYSDYSDDVVIDESGTIQVRGKTEDGRVLYEYTAKGNPQGTSCPSGVLFFE